MHLTRSTRLATAFVAAALLLGSGTAAGAKDNDDHGDRAQHELENARKGQERRTHRTPAVAQAKGTVASVDATARSFDLQVTEANQAALRGKRVTVQLASESYVSINDRKTTLADVKVGDSGKVTGLVDATTGRMTAYVARFSRIAPAPAQVKGPVTAVAAASFTVTVNGQPVALQLGTPSIVTLNGQPATLTDVHIGDKAEATTVTGVAYVARFSRSLPPSPAPVRVEGTVTSASPLVVLAKGMSVPVQLATPSVVSLNDAPATSADVHVGDSCIVAGIANPSGGLTAFHLACRRS
jgi:hypothetical protein